MGILEDFKSPPQEYRIKPFWFWNGDMTKEEIVYQIKEMSEKGLGGIFICARQGMTVPYLAKEWFDLVRFACDTAAEYGLEAWLYDEYPYPSGMSGGGVLLEHPEAEHMVLHHTCAEEQGEKEIHMDLGWGKVLYARAIPLTNDNSPLWDQTVDLKDEIGCLQTEKIYQKTGLTAYNNKRFFSYGPRKILKYRLPEGKWRVEVYIEAALGDFKYYGGFFDPCNREAVKSFLNTTHERYKAAMGDIFGRTVKGMFSDETGLLSPIPWSKLLPEVFEEKNGYSLLENLPALHNSSFSNACQVRYDLYKTIHELFRESYHKQVSDWCKENHLSYTTEVPSMRLGTQRYSDIIGGDTAHEKLGKSLEWIYDHSIRKYRSNAKAVSSLTRQLGKKYAMIESFHSIGWTMTLQDAKWMIDRLGSCGINLYNFHAFYYTIQDITKHDAPPSQFLQNPYWTHYRKLADYVGRMGALISNTEAKISIAVLDPASSLWTLLGNPFDGFWYAGEDEREKEQCDRIREDWVYICKTLLFHQIDYDHLDTEMLKEAEVSNGTIKLGKAEYKMLILPPSICMEPEVGGILKQFRDQGGCLIGLGLLPSESLAGDSRVREEYERLFGVETGDYGNDGYWMKTDHAAHNKYHYQVLENNTTTYFKTYGSVKDAGLEEKLVSICRKYCSPPVEIHITEGSNKELISCIREDENGDLYVFLGNQGKETLSLHLCINSEKCAEWYCLEDGSIRFLPLENGVVLVRLEAFESKWIRFGKTETAKERDTSYSQLVVPVSEPMKVSVKGGNICRFNRMEMSLDQVEWVETECQTFIEQCSAAKILQGEYLKFQGTFGTPKKIMPSYPMKCWYRIVVEADFEQGEIPKNISLLLDQETIAGKHRICINGSAIAKEDFQPYFINDQNNRICRISHLIKQGQNEILVEVEIEQDSDGIRDPLYLYGDFGVEGSSNHSYRLTKQPEHAVLTHTWCKGFPFYSGTLTYEQTLDLVQMGEVLDEDEKFSLRLGLSSPIYDCIEVSVNGNSLGVKAYTPYVWEGSTQWLKRNQNHIEIRITNTLANMLDGTYFDYETHELIEIMP